MLREKLFQTSLQGIGRAVALLFSKEGAKVVISECVLSVSPKNMLVMRLYSIDAKRLESVEVEIKAQGGDCLSVAGDVGADDFPKKIVDASIQYVSHTHSSEPSSFSLYRKWGKINHIVNNAGFTFDKMFHTMPDDTFDIIMKIHVRAPFRLIRQAAPYFRLKVYYNRSFFYHPYAHAHPVVWT